MGDSNMELKRYTDLPSLLHLLQEEKLTLLDPVTWDDRNDAAYMQIYKENQNLSSLLALCFTEATETHHHWKVFASGCSGVCVVFDKQTLLEQLHDVMGLRHGKVRYKTIKALKTSRLKHQDLPFLKRYPFRDEEEYRIIYENPKRQMASKAFDIDLSCIRRVVLSPWLPKPLREAVTSVIKSVSNDLKVHQTTLNENEEWKKIAQNCK